MRTLTQEDMDAIEQMFRRLLKPGKEPDFIPAEEAMKLLGRASKRTLYRLYIQGKVIATDGKRGEAKMYSRKSIEKYLNDKTVLKA